MERKPARIRKRQNVILCSPLPSFLSFTRPLNANDSSDPHPVPPPHPHPQHARTYILPRGHWHIVCSSASILSNLITFLPFVVSGAGRFAPCQWRWSHILQHCDWKWGAAKVKTMSPECWSSPIVLLLNGFSNPPWPCTQLCMVVIVRA